MKNFKLTEKSFLIGLFSVAFLVRLAFVLKLNAQPISGDSYDWMMVASDILSGKGFGDTWRPPGYSVYLAAIMFVFGKSLLTFKFMNVVLGSITCVLIYQVGKKVFSWQVGRIASVLVCFYPYLIAYTGDILSETFMTFMLALSLLLILICNENPSAKNIILTGIVLGLTTLTKSTVLPFFGLACLWLMWRTKNIKAGLILGVLTLLTVSPWTIRNYFYYGKFIPISTAGRSFYLACCDGAMFLESAGEVDRPQTAEMSSPAIPEEYGEILKLPRMEQEEIFTRKAKEWLKNNEDKQLYLLKARFLHFWRLYPMMAYKWQKLAAKLTAGIYIPLGIIGIFWSYKYFRKTSLLLMLFAVYTLVHIMFVVVMRYRIPIDPYMIIFASFTIHRVYMLLKPQQTQAKG